MVFELGKCYKHTTGKKFHIIGEFHNSLIYYDGLVAETPEGELEGVGIGEDYTVNWCEISPNEFFK